MGTATFNQGLLHSADPGFRRLFGLDAGLVPESTLPASSPTLRSLLSAESRHALEGTIYAVVRGGRVWEGELVARARGGRLFWVRVSAWGDPDGELCLLVRDVSRERRATEANLQRGALFELLARNSNDLIALHDQQHRYLYVSPAAQRLLGVAPVKLIGKQPWSLAHPLHVDRVRNAFTASTPDRERRITWRCRDRDGEFVWLETVIRPVATGQNSGAAQSASRDVSERKHYERELTHRAFHDPLTSLPNRSFFLSQVRRASEQLRRHGGEYGVLFLDLDGFKAVNDIQGHAAGDALLVETADRLTSAVRRSDLVARLGGDEFAVLLAPEDHVDTDGLVARIRGQFPIHTSADLEVAPSIGVTVATDPEEPIESVLRRADASMYADKRRPKRLLAATSQDVSWPELDLVPVLEGGNGDGGLLLRYQPIYDLETGRVRAVEALLRWQTPQGMVHSPQEILRAARAQGVGTNLTRWVVQHACDQMRAWAELELAPPRIAINLAGFELDDPGVIDLLQERLAAGSLAPSEIVVEVEEGSVLAALPTLQRIAALGVRIVIERFGSDQTSVRALRMISPASIKVDPWVVRSCRAEEGRGIVTAALGLARSVGADVGAVGIEHTDELRALRALGCAFGQGYLTARPGSPGRVQALLATTLDASILA